ncbi:aldose epimerase family protein [Caballeronia sp. LZ032]|uniref:aldose epimerase family protein n=1 Tax=Caballeronia sp. LZ032 TaxID=3038565 RepID=UPI0028638B50|nr:aldose epimerase family protein [Caballeronia sp. LZ032]MDR5881240.1 galactose mutarotase [Caballeronia sp. LZ032]
MTHSTSITMRPWGDVQLYTLRNESGMQIDISDLGATLVSWRAPDRDGHFADVLLSHDAPDDYLNSTAFMGAIVGRWANRIRDGRFVIDGVAYQVERNEGANHLHGGSAGFHRQMWQARIDGAALILSLHPDAGAAGFPGNLDVSVRYALDAHGTLSIDYEARTDAPTALNLTNHAYFNLSGSVAPEADIRDHEITIASDAYFAIDAGSIPIAREDVAGTAFDWRQPQSIRARLDESNEQVKLAGGFDHCYVLHDGKSQDLRDAATAYDASSGRELLVATDARGLQFYTGNHLEGEAARGGARYRKHAGLCLEAGGFPDGINMDGPARSDAVLRPGESFRQRTRYTLRVR